MAYPNQRIIYIERSSDQQRKDYFKIGNAQLSKAAQDLTNNAFKLYIYLSDNQSNFKLELSSKDYLQWSNTSDSSYDRAFKELKDKGYLNQSHDKKNIYLFVEESKTYYQRHEEDIILQSDKETIQQLFYNT